MITVILLFQMYTGFLVCFLGLGHLFNINLQLRAQFLFGDAADSTVIIPHADILQVIQLAEDTHLAEFADTCQ